ncbi:MAG: hypothetical protein AAF320_04905 [Myxococcota bacterium]
MIYKRHVSCLFAALLVALLQGCGGSGEAKFKGKLAGKKFNPAKTVFAYEVTKDAEGELLPQKYVMVVMSSFSFDPKKDLSGLSPDRLGSMRAKFFKSDVLVFRVMLLPEPNGLSFLSATHSDRTGQTQQASLLHRVQLGTRDEATTQRVAIPTFFKLSMDSYATTGDPPTFEGRVRIEHINPLKPFDVESFPQDPSARTVDARFKAPILDENSSVNNMKLLLDLPVDPPERAEGEQEKFGIQDLFYPIPASS